MQFVSTRLAAQLQRRTENYTYTDTAVYIPPSGTGSQDSYGQPSGSATESTIDCSFTDNPNAERWRNDADVQQLDAEIRFSSATTPTKGGKFRVTYQFGQAVTNRTFEIIGIQNRSQIGYVCALKAVKI